MKRRLLALGVTFFGSGVAAAQTPRSEDPPSVTVVHSDLDLSQADGRAILQRRVGLAIDALCLEEAGTSPLYFARASCRKFIWKSARPKIESATVRAQALSTVPPAPPPR